MFMRLIGRTHSEINDQIRSMFMDQFKGPFHRFAETFQRVFPASFGGRSEDENVLHGGSHGPHVGHVSQSRVASGRERSLEPYLTKRSCNLRPRVCKRAVPAMRARKES